MSALSDTKASRLMSYILRHRPDEYNITLTSEGWCSVTDLHHATKIPRQQILSIVASDDKGRYQLSAHNQKIRATQGHSSTQVDITFNSPSIVPAILLHGTARPNLSSILEQGLVNRGRHYVHLTEDVATALTVGKRYGDPIILEVDTVSMLLDGHKFYQSHNNVWLCPWVPPKYITIKQ